MKVEAISRNIAELQKPADALEAMAKRKGVKVEELIANAKAAGPAPTPTQARVLLLAERMEK